MSVIKTFEGREGHIAQKTSSEPVPLSCSNESLAGAVSQRACVYSGARVVLNPLTDALHLVHGPIGCASYTWDIRGSSTSGPDLYKNSFSTDMSELDIVFGGEKKLAKAIRELAERFRPPAIFVYSTCIVGIIGDDLKAVCSSAAEELDLPVIPVQSEGFRGNKNEGYKAACAGGGGVGTSGDGGGAPTGAGVAARSRVRWRRLRRRFLGRLAAVVDADQHRAHRHHLPDRAAELDHAAGHRRGHFDRGLVGHHVAQRLVLGDAVAHLDVPLDDLHFGDAFADVRHADDVHAHDPITLR